MNHREMKLEELIYQVKIELKKCRYSNRCIGGFATVWNRLAKYMDQSDKKIFNAKIGINFLEAEYGMTVYDRPTPKNRRHVRAVNLLSDYLLHGIVFARAKKAIRSYHPQFQRLFQGYIDEKKAEGLSQDTLKSYEIYLRRFSDYLNSRGIENIRDMDEFLVLGFTKTFTRYSPSVNHNTLCSLRTFFHYLFQKGFTLRDFAYVVPRDGYRQQTKVPSAYSKQEVEKLLKSIDRGNPKGKRDYAIILIAVKLGLRAQDICNLSFENLKWETNTIELVQEKTQNPIVLPLLEDVGLAIIDYLKYARLEFESTNSIFLRLTPPIGKLEAPTLHSIVTQHMRTAGIKIQNGRKHGPHALRHSLASALLGQNTPLPIISEVLGHTNIESTSVYLKIDVNQLRRCSLEPLTFDWNKGEEVF